MQPMLESEQRSRRHELQLESNSNRVVHDPWDRWVANGQGLVTCGCHRRRTDAHRLSRCAFLAGEIESRSSYGTFLPVTWVKRFKTRVEK